MCGIIGYIGDHPAAQVLLNGLSSLEYRGYDSAGVALLNPVEGIVVRKAPGKLSGLISAMKGQFPDGTVGIGHTRWATHGHPNLVNAHPHRDCDGKVVIVHNGIVENYRYLKIELVSKGHRFESETDSEVISHLIEAELNQGREFPEAVRKAALKLQGASAVVALSVEAPDLLIAFRIGNAGGITVGYGEGEMLVASDLPAILPMTNRAVFLEPGVLVSIQREGASFQSMDGKNIKKTPRVLPMDAISAAKGGYKHFMLKEIIEQPEAITRTLRGQVTFDPVDVSLEDIRLSEKELTEIDRVVLIGMGTSMHAATAGRYMVEQLAGIPAEVDNASEFRYRQPILGPRTLLISVSQSGETADTLGAMEEMAKQGVRQITICNVEESQATRIADGTIYIGAGPEMSVASTKCLTGSMVGLYLLAVYLGKVRGFLSTDRMTAALEELAALPRLMGEVLQQKDHIERLAQRYFKYEHFLFLGRGINTSTAMEGALKLKEVSYIHAEGYAAGEMKHGPIALIEESMPVVVVAPRNDLYDKTLNNIAEVKARQGTVIALTTQGNDEIREKVDDVIEIPETSPLLTPVVGVVPLQLLAYDIAVNRGCDVDQPRNLAKTVTVE
ncbi:MAG: glutamine--fructose-6-phosphate transaminase (isomerizing) [SAR202 cluster bacterium Io17-Chloro-G3]|nr:MAG: glutamine--fructose-6-phosphate transaminase (isomerizing) [SAR202 cluster bacterium Io17-Chloro-G3]